MANPILISNQALRKPQPATMVVEESTGTIVYANNYSGVGKVDMPDDWAVALNSDFGETGNNIIIQLQQKVQQMPEGPWYVDSRDGVIYIHNRKLQEPSVADYTYQAENGELLSVNFETQYVTKILRASTSSGIDMNKGLNTEVVGMSQTNIKMADETYLDYYDPKTGAYKPQSAINAYNSGKLSFSSLMALNDRVKEKGHKSAYTKAQWDQIHAIHQRKKEEERKAQKDYTESVYAEYQNAGTNAAGVYREKAITETLETKDLEANVTEFLAGIYGPDGGNVQAELEQAARNGTLDQVLKNRYNSTTYTFTNTRKDNGATVTAWTDNVNVGNTDGHISLDEIDRNPYQHRLSGIRNDGTVKVFTKANVQATVSGYRLLRAYYTRKYGRYTSSGTGPSGEPIDQDLSRRVLGTVNASRKITERKLMAKAIVIGRPSLSSSQVINIHNVGKKWSGSWYIKKCTHRINGSSGYTTEIELIRHKEVEGYQAAVQSTSHNHDTSSRATGGEATSKPLTSMNLTSAESNYFNAATRNRKEDLLILKMAGVNDAVTPRGNTGSLSKTTKVSFDMVRMPTDEERRKYGRAASQAVDKGIKSGPRK